MIRRYSELKKLKTFEERFNYLRLNGIVGSHDLGYERFLTQTLYRDSRWLAARDKVIIRDNSCDLGIIGYDIYDKINVHHMNPVTEEQVNNDDPILFDPEFLISTSDRTHKAIHYNNSKNLLHLYKERALNDTIPWKQ